MQNAPDNTLSEGLPNAVWCGHDNEIWGRDPHDPDLWHNRKGLIINSAALRERMQCFEIGPIRLENGGQPVNL